MTGNKSEKPARYSAPALEKGMAILELLSQSTHGCTMNELSAQLGRSVSEIFRMVIVLEELGYIAADASDRYSLTLRLFHLVHRHYPVRQLTECALPLLQQSESALVLLLFRWHNHNNLAGYHTKRRHTIRLNITISMCQHLTFKNINS